MDVFHTFCGDPGFDIQLDVHLARGEADYSAGPDRLYLIHPYRDAAGLEGEETAGIWRTDLPEAAEAVASILGIPDAKPCLVRPWYLRWIRAGEIAVRQHWLGLDRGMHLIELMQSHDLLDRRAHLFGLDQETGA